MHNQIADNALCKTIFNNNRNLGDKIFYVDNYEYYWDRAFNPPWWCFSPFMIWNNNCNFNHNMEIAIAFKKGVDWFPTLNDSYKSLIGALELVVNVQQNQTGCQCDEYNYGELVNSTYFGGATDCESMSQGNGYNWSYECSPTYSVSYTYIDKPSDGFILVESAQALPKYKAQETTGTSS